jgi:hypothetical protein
MTYQSKQPNPPNFPKTQDIHKHKDNYTNIKNKN